MCHFFFFFYLGGFNFSSSQLPDNRTIKGFAEAYVDKLISRYPVTYHTMNFVIDF